MKAGVLSDYMDNVKVCGRGSNNYVVSLRWRKFLRKRKQLKCKGIVIGEFRGVKVKPAVTLYMYHVMKQ